MSSDSLRLVFSAIFAICLVLLWQRWELHQASPGTDSARPSSTQPATSPSSQPSLSDSDLPTPTQELRAADGDENAQPFASADSTLDSAARKLRVETDWLSAEISEEGATLISLSLKRHLEDLEFRRPFRLLQSGDRNFVAQSGLIGENLPNHKTRFAIIGDSEVTVTGDSLTISLIAQTENTEVIKTYTFRRESYLIDVGLEVRNTGDSVVAPLAYYEIAHDGKSPRGHSSLLPSFFGAALFTEENKFQKIPFDEIGDEDYPRKSDNGWIGIVQRYFLTAWLASDDGGEREFFLRRLDGGAGVGAGAIAPMGNIPPGESKKSASTLYAGAQEQHILNELNESGKAPGIHLAVDYGWLTLIAVFLFQLLDLIHGYVGNWGLAILLLTFLVKLCFYPLSAASYRSMAKLRAVSPRLVRLKEKFGGDKQKMQQAMMSLYREEKINPLGGCLPILVQIPVFIALYWVLLGSVELRHAPFALWIADLSAPDPYYVTPLLLGGGMFLQTRMSPSPPDPTQAMIMKAMPIGFAVFSVFFPSGLVLYWLANTLLSISQQWHITRGIEKAANRARGK